MSHFLQPQIILLRNGTDTSQGTPQLISNINACSLLVSTLQSTLGPRGMDKLFVNKTNPAKVFTTITNDGATLLDLLSVQHPAARILVDVAKAQDSEVGDGTTSATILAGAFLEAAKPFINEGTHPQTIIKSFNKGNDLALAHLKALSVPIAKLSDRSEYESMLRKCAETSLNSKLIAPNKKFFSKMIVDAVSALEQNLLDLDMIAIKKIAGGSIEDSMLVKGVAFKKTFSYAGFEQQPKKLVNPKILALNLELELKSEAPNAEMEIKADEFQKFVDAEWKIIYNKLEHCVKSGAKIILSKLPVGDLATQYFADRGIFCAGRVAESDLERVCKATSCRVLSSVSNIDQNSLGSCALFEEKQVGGVRYNFFTGCTKAQTATIILRGGAEQFLAESERSLHDAIMIVRRTIRCKNVVGGAGAIEMELSKNIREYAKTVPSKHQMILRAYAKALERIPKQLAANAGFDSIDILNKLRAKHARDPKGTWYGVDIENEGICDAFEKFIWEPVLVKQNAIKSATEAACLIISIDETIHNDPSDRHTLQDYTPQGMAAEAAMARQFGG